MPLLGVQSLRAVSHSCRPEISSSHMKGWTECVLRALGRPESLVKPRFDTLKAGER